jgi:hypothetical protein
LKGEPENGKEARETVEGQPPRERRNERGRPHGQPHEQGLLVFTLFVMCLMLFSSGSVKTAPVEQLAPLTIAGTQSCRVVQGAVPYDGGFPRR